MDKTYHPQAIEQNRYQHWENNGDFTPPGTGPAYCIMIPPPNVTGTLHMGHAFQDTLMDALIRYHRMRGANALWQVGTDHAGIATQMVVERQLKAENKTRHDLGREAFVERVWEWKATSGGTITQQLRRMGAAVDWSRERFTMDPMLSKAVREVFVRLYDEGLIYRGQRLVNWDPVLHTAISDLEVENNEEQGHLWHLRYPRVDGKGHVVVATTRPETMLGDCAVAVNPADERYQDLIGLDVELPLTGRRIPVIADDYVDPEFGSGCVKITPAHDFNDYAVGQRHALPLINIFTRDACINENGPAAYRGLDRYEARRQIVADLQAQNLLDRIDDHKLMVPRGDRSGAVVEPYLTDQWFVDLTRHTLPDGRPGGYQAITKPAIDAVQHGQVEFIPGNWAKTYFNWLNDIQDWCISRQIWWGHRIPAWYDEAGQCYVGHSESAVRQKYALPADLPLTQDVDVLDTWFSSALWPFSTLGWPDDTSELATFYPTSVLVTGFDIIFFWVARMIMMGMKFMGEVPFRQVYIHGLVRDADGQKMSKSKGNVLDPIDLIDGIGLDDLVAKRTQGLMQPKMAAKIEQQTRKHFPDGIPAYGCDALRFTFAVQATTGRDIRFDMGRVEGYRNFCNKLWNAARYVLMNTSREDNELASGPLRPTLPDRWIRSHLQYVITDVNEHISQYRFDLASQCLYELVWHEYCDWYLEFAKPVLTGKHSDAAAQRATRQTLVEILECILRLLHPIMPFITEEIWRQIAPSAGRTGDTLLTQPYPLPDLALVDADAQAELDWVKQFIMGIRRIRSEMDIAPGKALPVLVHGWQETERARFDANRTCIDALAKIESIDWVTDDATIPESATALVGEIKLYIPLAGLIDQAAELTRLEKEIGKLTKNLERSTAKLANASFIDKAPADVVEKEQARVAEMRHALAELQAQQAKIRALK